MKETNILLSSVEVMLVTITNYLRNFNILYNVKIGLSRGFSRPMWVGVVGENLQSQRTQGTSERGNDGKLGTCSHYCYLMAAGGGGWGETSFQLA